MGRDEKRTPLKKPALEASYNTSHNFFVLEDRRSNSLLQTYKLVVLKEILAFKNTIRVVERTEVKRVVLIDWFGCLVSRC